MCRRSGCRRGSKDVDKLQIVEHLRRDHGIHADLSDFRVDDAQCAVSFKGPGYTADTFIDRDSGKYEVTETRLGWGAIINDLHKGRRPRVEMDDRRVGRPDDAGIGHRLALIFFLARRRLSGLVMAGAGAVACYAVYAIWVR